MWFWVRETLSVWLCVSVGGFGVGEREREREREREKVNGRNKISAYWPKKLGKQSLSKNHSHIYDMP